VAAEGVVVNAIEVLLKETVPEVVVIENARLASPATVNASAEVVEPGTKPTLPPTEPTPAAVTLTVPPVPVVNLPKPSAAPLVCVSVIGATTVAVAEPAVVAEVPAANAGVAERMAMAEAMMIFFTCMLPVRYAATCPSPRGHTNVKYRSGSVPNRLDTYLHLTRKY
jgi:hypothetical protein